MKKHNSLLHHIERTIATTLCGRDSFSIRTITLSNLRFSCFNEGGEIDIPSIATTPFF